MADFATPTFQQVLQMRHRRGEIGRQVLDPSLRLRQLRVEQPSYPEVVLAQRGIDLMARISGEQAELVRHDR